MNAARRAAQRRHHEALTQQAREERERVSGQLTRRRDQLTEELQEQRAQLTDMEAARERIADEHRQTLHQERRRHEMRHAAALEAQKGEVERQLAARPCVRWPQVCGMGGT